MSKQQPKITILEAAFVFIFLIVALLSTILIFGGGPHIPMLAATICASLIAVRKGFRWSDIEQGIFETIKMSMQSILILLIIGVIIGTWILGGIVPTMIYYGLKILSPSVFLVMSCIICSIVSISTGSSWTTIGTIGVALVGVGRGLGIPDGLIVGSIISGAYFGDKMSPLSDTTNLAPAMAGANMFDHIKHMVYTTTPSLAIALILYGVLGARYAGGELDTVGINQLLDTMSATFHISPLMFIPPVLVILMVIKKVPAIPGLLGGGVLGAIFAALFQGAGLTEIIAAAHYGYSSSTGIEAVDSLLSGGGLNSMMWTISLVLLALSFSGVIEHTGMLKVIVDKIIQGANTDGKLILATIITSIFTNYTTGVQYVALVLPARMYKDIYRKRGLAPKNLSRATEDSGTLVAPLVPWSTDGAFISGALGVSPMTYIPYCFMNLINPIISIIYGFTGFSIAKLTPEEREAAAQNENAGAVTNGEG